jgi:hypothetical protein
VEELARRSQTPAGRLATERLTAAALDPELYPDGTALIAADAPDFLAMMGEEVAEGRPLAILYPDGHEVLVTPVDGALAGLLAKWWSRDRPVVRSADGADITTLPRKYRVQLRLPPGAVA